MLVLSRRVNQQIRFPTLDITIELLRIRGNTAKLGITAPRDTPVYRQELADLKGIDFVADEPLAQLRRLAALVAQRLGDAATALNRLHAHLEERCDEHGLALVLDVFRELRALDREAEASLEDHPTRTARVLIVQSDANQRRLLASYLEVLGIETVTASGDDEAWEFLSLHCPPDAVLLECDSAALSACPLLRRLQSEPRLASTKRMALTDVPCDELTSIERAPPIDYCFGKPLDPEQVAQTIIHAFGAGV